MNVLSSVERRGGLVNKALIGVAGAMFAYQVAIIWYPTDPLGGADIHLAFALTILILATMGKARWLTLLLGVAAIAFALYGNWYLYANNLPLTYRVGYLIAGDYVAIVPLVALVFVYTWRTFGPAFPIIGALFLVYAFMGHLVPEPLSAPQTEFSRMAGRLVLRLHGIIVGFSWQFLWLIIVFGAFLQASGAAQFIWVIAGALAKRIPGGPALVAVVSSSLVGSFTAAGAANVGITGVVSIPAMKQTGWTGDQAAAIEAIASHGGAFTPPIMGAVAFIMAEFLGVSYVRILAAFAIPAFLYYFSLGVYIVQYARRNNLAGKMEGLPTLPTSVAVKSGVLFLGPLAVLMTALLQGLPIQHSVFWALVALAVLSLIIRLERDPAKWITALKVGAVAGAGIACAGAIIDLMLATTEMTNLTLKSGFVIRDLSGGTYLGTFLILAVAAYILGLGLPGLPIYIIAALLLAPVLIKLGASPLATHAVSYYLAGLASITLPVASTVLVAARIASASYWSSGIWALKFGVSILMLPFFMFWAPEILLEVNDGWPRFFAVVPMVIVAIFMAQVGVVGYLRTILSPVERVMALSVPLAIWLSLYMENWLFAVAGMVLLAAVVVPAFWRKAPAEKAMVAIGLEQATEVGDSS